MLFAFARRASLNSFKIYGALIVSLTAVTQASEVNVAIVGGIDYFSTAPGYAAFVTPSNELNPLHISEGASVDQGTIYYDFHGEHSNDPKNSQRYREEQETTKSNGTFVAPFDGIHGWFWLNLTGKPQVVTLKMSGYYELHKMEK